MTYVVTEQDDYSWGLSDDELSVLRRRMEAFNRVGNDRSYVGIALMRAAIEG